MAKFKIIDEYLLKGGSVYAGDDDTRSFNVENILLTGVLSLGNSTEWYVSVTFISGKTLLANVTGTPFATKALAVVAKNTFVTFLEAL